MFLRRILVAVLLAKNPLALCAQPELQLFAGGGAGSGVSRSSTTKYAAIFQPRAEARLRIPLNARLAVVSGLALQAKGYRSTSRIDDKRPGDYTIIAGVLRCTQLQIPLQLGYTAVSKAGWALELTAGMSYGFILSARSRSDWNFYRKEQLVHTDRFERSVPTALMPYDNRISSLPARQYGALYLFNPALAAGVTVRSGRRLLLQAYGEYNLYDLATVSVAPLRVYSLGLMAGYRI